MVQYNRSKEQYPPADAPGPMVTDNVITEVAANVKRGSEPSVEHVTKRGRLSSPDSMDMGLFVPAFGLDIFRCDEDEPIHDIAEVNAITDHDDAEEWEASDDVKGGVLDARQVKEARAKELDYLRDHGVYEYAYKVDAKKVTGRPPIRLMWI